MTRLSDDINRMVDKELGITEPPRNPYCPVTEDPSEAIQIMQSSGSGVGIDLRGLTPSQQTDCSDFVRKSMDHPTETK